MSETLTAPGKIVHRRTLRDGRDIAVYATDDVFGKTAHYRFEVDGVAQDTGPFVAIDRRNLSHKNAPAAATHLIGGLAFTEEQAREFVAATAGIEADHAARRAELQARSAEAGRRWRRAVADRVARPGLSADEVLAAWERYRTPERAHAAEDVRAHSILMRVEIEAELVQMDRDGTPLDPGMDC